MANSKCFCHWTDKKTGESYEVKDAFARRRIEEINGTKLDKVTTNSLFFRVYGINLDGSQTVFSATNMNSPYSVAKRDMNGRLQVSDPTSDLDVANKKYVDAKAATLQTEIDTLETNISTIPKFDIEVVSELPTTDISTTTVYLKPCGDESPNIYEEYIYVNGTWEKLGTQTVDLSSYLPLSGGTMTGEIKVGQNDGYGIQLGTNGRINATTPTGGTTATVCGINGQNCLLGHGEFNTTLRGKASRPTYNGDNLALSSDIPTVNNSTLTMQLNGKSVGTFTANASSNVTANIQALPNFSNNIGNTNAGNPRQVKFLTIDYNTAATYFKMSATGCHDNGTSYQFLEDIIIGCTTAGDVVCNVYKYCQQSCGTNSYNLVDGLERYYGDVFYVKDETNKVVDFYILMGQYSSAQFTPPTKIGSTTIQYVTPLTGTPVYHSSGTRVWANGNSTIYAKFDDIPTNYVTTDTDQTITGTKDFTTRPTVNGEEVALKSDVTTVSDSGVELLTRPYTSSLDEMSRNTPNSDNYMFGSNFNHMTYSTIYIPTSYLKTTSYTYAKKLVVDFDVYIGTSSSTKSAYPVNYKLEYIQPYTHSSGTYHYYVADVLYYPSYTPQTLFRIPAHTSAGYTTTGACVQSKALPRDGSTFGFEVDVYGITTTTSSTSANKSYCSFTINSIKAYY